MRVLRKTQSILWPFASNGNALKTQILLSRLQFQEAAVARASERLNDARGRLVDTQRRRAEVAARLKRLEESLDNTNNTAVSPADQKQVQLAIAGNKVQLENATAEEQQRQSSEMDAEEQLRTEQAKLGALEDRLDRMEKELDNPH